MIIRNILLSLMLFITDWNHKLTVEVTKEAKTYDDTKVKNNHKLTVEIKDEIRNTHI